MIIDDFGKNSHGGKLIFQGLMLTWGSSIFKGRDDQPVPD